MADWPGEGGTLGGTQICNVSPSDSAGTIDNLKQRVEKLENTVAQILSGNVEALQLSDIAASLGWVTDVTYLGTDGFTLTPAGTLIPPTGWTGLSSVIDGLSGLSLYSGGNSVGGFNTLSVYNYDWYGIDIGAGGGGYIHPYQIPSDWPASGDTGLYEGTAGGDTAWIRDSMADFLIFIYAQINAGTTNPTYGFTRCAVTRQEVGGSNWFVGDVNTDVDPTGVYPTYINGVVPAKISKDAVDGFKFRIYNRTDGDIWVNKFIVTFMQIG